MLLIHTTKTRRLLIVLLCLIHFYGFGQQPDFSVLITEIMADPTPSHGLPEKEYLELFNPTSKAIDLKGYTLNYAQSSVVFPAFIIQPDEYLIVCRENNVSFFEPYGRVIGLEKFSLLNGGTTLALSDPSGQLAFKVSYSSDWYAEGRDQGYSLEMIDVSAACKSFGNWTSSEDETGGTPGRVNASTSEIKDMNPPSYSFYETNDQQTFVFTFSEELSGSGEYVQSSAPLESFRISSNTLIVTLQKGLSEGSSATFIFDHLSDCLGNTLNEAITLTITNATKARKGEIVLSEILFNPVPGGEDFVELVNLTDQLLDISHLRVARFNAAGEPESIKALGSFLIIEPNGILCFTTNKAALLETYPRAISERVIETESLPAFSNESGSLILMNQQGEIYEQMTYTEDRHHWSIDNPDGVSLERIDLGREAAYPENWESVSSAFGNATPGFRPDYSGEEAFSISADPMIISPDGDGIDDATEISVLSKYSGTLTLELLDINGMAVKRFSNNAYLGHNSTYYWDGNDAQGDKMSVGYYLLHGELVTTDRIMSRVIKVLLLANR